MKKHAFALLMTVALSLAGCGNQTTQQPAPQQNEQQPEASQPEATPSYPEKQITLVIQAAPGGASDTISRSIGKLLEEKLNVPVVPINKTGAAGAVAMSYLEASPKDGYTIGYVPVELSMVKALGYADIEPSKYDLLGRANILPAALTVPVEAPYDTLEEFIQYAKQNPGKIRVGNSGSGSIWHVAAAGFAQAAEIELSHVPFDGAAPAVTALMGGHIDAVTVSSSEVKSGIDGNKLKVLAVLSEERDPTFPEIPTLKEKGIDTVIMAWGGFAMPKDTPKEIKDVLVAAIEEAINSDEFKELCKQRNMIHSYQSPEEFTKFAQEQFDYYMNLIPEMGL